MFDGSTMNIIGGEAFIRDTRPRMNGMPMILAPSSMDNTIPMEYESRQRGVNMNVDLRSKSVIVEDNTPGGVGERTSTQLSHYDSATQQNTPNNQSTLNKATLPDITTVRLAKRL